MEGEQLDDEREVRARTVASVAGLGFVGQTLDGGGLAGDYSAEVFDAFDQLGEWVGVIISLLGDGDGAVVGLPRAGAVRGLLSPGIRAVGRVLCGGGSVLGLRCEGLVWSSACGATGSVIFAP